MRLLFLGGSLNETFADSAPGFTGNEIMVDPPFEFDPTETEATTVVPQTQRYVLVGHVVIRERTLFGIFSCRSEDM